MPHVLKLTAADGDIDDLGHVNNVVYVRWIVDAAVDHSTALGLSPAAYRERRAAFVVRRQQIDYLRPAVRGDDLNVETRVLAMRTASSERETLIRMRSTGALILAATTLWAYIDLTTGRPTRIPADIRDRYPIEAAGPRE